MHSVFKWIFFLSNYTGKSKGACMGSLHARYGPVVSLGQTGNKKECSRNRNPSYVINILADNNDMEPAHFSGNT